jgi:hypothetical protein
LLQQPSKKAEPPSKYLGHPSKKAELSSKYLGHPSKKAESPSKYLLRERQVPAWRGMLASLKSWLCFRRAGETVKESKNTSLTNIGLWHF